MNQNLSIFAISTIALIFLVAGCANNSGIIKTQEQAREFFMNNLIKDSSFTHLQECKLKKTKLIEDKWWAVSFDCTGTALDLYNRTDAPATMCVVWFDKNGIVNKDYIRPYCTPLIEGTF